MHLAAGIMRAAANLSNSRMVEKEVLVFRRHVSLAWRALAMTILVTQFDAITLAGPQSSNLSELQRAGIAHLCAEVDDNIMLLDAEQARFLVSKCWAAVRDLGDTRDRPIVESELAVREARISVILGNYGEGLHKLEQTVKSLESLDRRGTSTWLRCKVDEVRYFQSVGASNDAISICTELKNELASRKPDVSNLDYAKFLAEWATVMFDVGKAAEIEDANEFAIETLRAAGEGESSRSYFTVKPSFRYPVCIGLDRMKSCS